MGKTTLLTHIAARKLAIPSNIDVLLCEQGIDLIKIISVQIYIKIVLAHAYCACDSWPTSWFFPLLFLFNKKEKTGSIFFLAWSSFFENKSKASYEPGHSWICLDWMPTAECCILHWTIKHWTSFLRGLQPSSTLLGFKYFCQLNYGNCIHIHVLQWLGPLTGNMTVLCSQIIFWQVDLFQVSGSNSCNLKYNYQESY